MEVDSSSRPAGQWVSLGVDKSRTYRGPGINEMPGYADTHGEMDEMDHRPDRYLIEPGEFPHGLRCMDCDESLTPGDTYSKRLVAFMGDEPVVELICVPCAIWGKEKTG